MQRAGGLFHGGTQGLVLVPEITRDGEQIGAQLLQEAEQDTRRKDL